MTGEPQPEVWADVAGFVGLYQVSNLGRVASFRSRGSHRPRNPNGAYLLNPGVSSWGYVRVNLSINNVASLHKVHILVARAFIPNPDGKPEVNHIDLDKTNNRASNLEWATGGENLTHYYASTEGSGRGTNSMPDNDVLDIRACAFFGASIAAIAQAFGLSRRRIERIISRRYYSHI